MDNQIQNIAQSAKNASFVLASTNIVDKNKALKAIANALLVNAKEIINANNIDMELAQKAQLAAPLLKRLKFDESKIKEVVEGVESLINLPDPTGNILSKTELDTDFTLEKVTCPIGVIGVIFESRPDALVQISSLCLKSGNAVLLKGGSEATNTNRILSKIIAESTSSVGIVNGWIQILETRAEVAEMLKLDKYIDLIIPRGSNEFVRYIMDNSNIAVLGHADGICHVYIDSEANIDMAVRVATDSKTQYVAVCNAAETFLVHKDIAKDFLPKIKESLDSKNTEIRGCSKTQQIINCKAATSDDWATEYLDYIVSIKIVDDINEAIEHINTYGSGHTDAIVTKKPFSAEMFMNNVDTGDAFWNCSTRFADGFRYGLGAEVGISTNKIHARGPVGLEGLVIYKWKARGTGNIVDDYSTGKRKFTHKKLI